MSEEEQLNAAIAASLNPNTPTDTADQSTSSTTAPTTILHDQEDTKMESDDDDDDDDKNDHQDETTAASVLDSILPVKRQETTDIANSTRIQFRMADGSRVIRRFLKSDPVRHLFEFIKSEVPETQDQAFEVKRNTNRMGREVLNLCHSCVAGIQPSTTDRCPGSRNSRSRFTECRCQRAVCLNYLAMPPPYFV